MRVEVGQERVAQAAERIGEGDVRPDRVDADAQDLGIGRLEALTLALQFGQFVLSATGPIEDVERQNNVLFPAILRKGDRPTGGRRHGEVGCFLPDLRHVLLLQTCLLFRKVELSLVGIVEWFVGCVKVGGRADCFPV
jgi:hypothetical protein